MKYVEKISKNKNVEISVFPGYPSLGKNGLLGPDKSAPPCRISVLIILADATHSSLYFENIFEFSLFIRKLFVGI